MEKQQPGAADTAEARAALCTQLGIVDESVWRIAIILVGVALSLRATLLQKNVLERLLCGESTAAAPEAAPIRIVASLLILSSLFFFTKLSGKTLCAAPEGSERCSAEIDHKGNLLVLAVALARLWDLLRKLPETAAQADTDTGAAVDSEPPIA